MVSSFKTPDFSPIAYGDIERLSFIYGTYDGDLSTELIDTFSKFTEDKDADGDYMSTQHPITHFIRNTVSSLVSLGTHIYVSEKGLVILVGDLTSTDSDSDGDNDDDDGGDSPGLKICF